MTYGNLGKIYFIEKSINYSGYTPYEPTGIYIRFIKSPSFSLLLTWEKIIGNIFNVDRDDYFKTIQVYYGILIILLFLFLLSRKNIDVALLGSLLLISGYAYFYSLINYHLDLYRIYFLLISWIFLGYAIKKEDFFSISLLGIFSGFTAFVHSIGMVVAVFNILAVFIFLKANLKVRLIKTGLVSALIFLFGGLHYFIDIFWGSGWQFSHRGKFPIKEIIKIITKLFQ
ncbi:MAG: hypothetical protein ACTSRZ_20450 [Promethearchaeota archaeon]